MLVRRESPADAPAVRDLVAAAFTRLGEDRGATPVEVSLLDALRDCGDWIPELSLVATATPADGRPIGYVVCTRGRVGATPVLGLGPLAVHPDHQGRGVGSALVHAALGAADALGEPLVALLGSPDYYRRFGFRTSAEHGITPPDPEWGEHFQIRTLTAHDPALRGEFTYARPFQDI